MSKQKAIFLVIGVVVGFIVGFAVANSANRTDQDALRAENARLKSDLQKNSAAGQQTASAPAEQGGLPKISEEQMRAAVKKADDSPSDASIQKMSGQVLFLYATQTGDAGVIPDAARILKRAHEAAPKDFESLMLLGNALFILARNGEPARLGEARAAYEKALTLEPDDPTAHTSLGLTYFYDRPSDPQRAIAEYRKSLAKEPGSEMALQGMSAALIAVDNFAEAQKMLAELERANASNSQLQNLRAQLAQKKNAAKEKD